MMDLTKACNGPRFGTETGTCNIMKPKRGMEIAEVLTTLSGTSLQRIGSQVIMKYRSLSAMNGKPPGLLL
jgi:hypothetical protein